MSSFPLWRVDPVQSQRITGTRIFLGIFAGFLFLPSLFVIVGTLLNVMVASGYAIPQPVHFAFYLASEALPFGLIAVIAALPFCFAARRSGHIGIGPVMILSLSIFLLLSAALWVARLIYFDPGAFFMLAGISQVYGLAVWLILRVVCFTGFRNFAVSPR